MKLSRLNSSGIAHHFVLALAIVGIVSAFAFQAVAGKAATSLPDGQAVRPSTSTNTSTGCNSRPTLSVGSSGACVKLLQTRLGVSADGNFGPRTKAAVVAFQKTKGLAADGVVGPKTWAALGGSKTAPKQASTPKTTKPTTLKPANKPGYKTAIGRLTGNCSVTPTTGHCYSNDTYAICARVYQVNTNGVPATATFGPVKFNSTAKDKHFKAKTLTVNNTLKCHNVTAKYGGIVPNKWTTIDLTITAGPNSQITFAYVKTLGHVNVWDMILTNAL